MTTLITLKYSKSKYERHCFSLKNVVWFAGVLISIFTVWLVWSRSSTITPRTAALRFIQFTILVDYSFIFFIYSLSFFDLCLGLENNNFQRWRVYILWPIWPRPSGRTPTPGVLKFVILSSRSLLIIIIYLICLTYARKKYINFTYTFNCYPRSISPGGHGSLSLL